MGLQKSWMQLSNYKTTTKSLLRCTETVKCTSNLRNLILEKDAQYLYNYYIESMLKLYFLKYIELNKATIKI